MATVATPRLTVGDVLYTSAVLDRRDFGIPLVLPIQRLRGRHVRVVRNVVKCRGGHVVWFTDGTKTPPLHGRTVWLLAETREEAS